MDTNITAALASAADSSAGTSATTNTNTTLDVGYNVNLSSDVVGFADSLERADAIQTPVKVEPSALAEALFAPLEYINEEAGALVEYAQNAVASGNELSPSEVVMLTARSQEFMFHSQLTANVANRTAEGLQQLFRQQS